MSGWPVLGAVIVLIGLNGLFVAAEFAVVSARGPGLDELVEAGDRRADGVDALLGRPPRFLSMVQFGITVTSLVVGLLADRALGETLVAPLLEAVGLPAEGSAALSVALALVLATLLQMVFGELLPKNLAVARPVPVARALVGFSRASLVILGPVARVLDRAAELVTRLVLRVEAPQRLEAAPGLDELSRIITASGARGSLSTQQTELLRRAVTLGGRRVGEVMVPRPDIIWVVSGSTLEEMTAVALRSGHSRFPIRGATEDEVLGTVHVKDQLQVPSERRALTTVDEAAAEPLFVPESETLRALLDEFRQRRRTFAVVVDEFGSTAGIVTLEDVLEALVGDVEDEFDRARAGSRRSVAVASRVPGATTLARFAEQFGVELPAGPYETIAGLMMAEVGRIPEVGDRTVHGGLELRVTRRDGLRVTEIVVRATGAER